MAVYQKNKIQEDVRTALDQNMNSDTLKIIGDVDTLALDDIIASKILEAVKRVHSSAPSYLLDGGHNFGDAIYWKEHESGWILLPEDFMRFVVFQMNDWERAVFNPINTDDPEYEKQSSRFKGIRGTCQRPVCAIHTTGRKSDGILFMQNDRSESEPCCISALPENRQIWRGRNL